jgi:hypothetical protein
MRNLQVALISRTRAGFSRPAQANSFFPVNNQTDHIHLGTPTNFVDGTHQRSAENGNAFVTYVSFKRTNATWFRLVHNDLDGYFSFPADHNADELPQSWQDELRPLRIVRGLGA